MFTEYDLVLNSLTDQLAVIDYTGKIVFVNKAWVNFGLENGSTITDWSNYNYYNVCESSDSIINFKLLQLVNDEISTFDYEYPCHSPTEQRWFLMKASKMVNNNNYIVIVHVNITLRKLAEIQLEELTYKDPLTSLFNRRKLTEMITREWAVSLRHRASITVMIIDIDHFKLFNDTYGHLKGDECLSQIANWLLKSSREEDLVARYGGEEFVICLPNTNESQAKVIGERIIQNVRKLNIPHITHETLVTCSIGSASIVPSHNNTITELFAAADNALYTVKRASRNSIQCITI
jgi:diguanylate cyclase (GGDEF)-like protein